MPFLWWRADTNLKPLSVSAYHHEKQCADLYVAYAPHLTESDYWDTRWLDDERKKLRFPSAFNDMPKVLQITAAWS